MIPTLYRLFLRTQVTRGRVLALLGLGAVGVVVGFAIGRADNTLQDGVEFVNGFGLVVLVPVATLTFAAASIGDMVEDQTLVYLWLRPFARWRIAVAAALASMTVVVPVVAVPLTLAASATGYGDDLVLSSLLASVVGVAAYTGLFVLLGVLTRRSMLWGLGYILIWEGFIARAGGAADNLAIRAYTRSILSESTDVPLELANESMATAIAVPLVVLAAALALTSYLLDRRDVA